LQSIGGDKHFAANEVELETSSNRLELLAVVRGLEALEEPSRVTLLTASRYVNRGIRHGISQWRERKWRWERFGQLVPIRNQDLWQRVDRALQFHQVECWPVHFMEESREQVEAVKVVPAADVSAAYLPAAEATSPEMEATSAPQWRFDAPESNEGVRSPFFRTWNRLRQGVLAPLAAIWRPAFTRAA
jgi:ribonuclease HI